MALPLLNSYALKRWPLPAGSAPACSRIARPIAAPSSLRACQGKACNGVKDARGTRGRARICAETPRKTSEVE